MKCLKCGNELEPAAKFCSVCGAKIDEETPVSEEKPQTAVEPVSDEPSAVIVDAEPVVEENQGNVPPSTQSSAGDSFISKMKAKFLTIWNGMDLFTKIISISIAVVALLLLIAACMGKGAAIFFALSQLGGVIVALLMHKNVIKLGNKQWIKFLVFMAAVAMTVLTVLGYGAKGGYSGKTDTQNPFEDVFAEPTEPVSPTAQMPYSAEECVGLSYMDLRENLETLGFINIRTEEVEDLKYAEADKQDTIASITIAGKSDFAKDEVFNKNDEIVITYHDFKKCEVTIHVDFIPNLLFNKYDVNLLVDGDEEGTLDHGTDGDFKVVLDPGEYTITFESDDSSSVDGEVELLVDCDLEVAYKISCGGDQISVETLYVDRQVELADGQVKLDVPASEYEYKIYTDVEAALKKIGFTNIKHEVLYDIYWGLTSDGEVDSVSIAGKKDFNRGDVFPADAEIIITYHMPEDADPSYIKMPKDSKSYEGMNYLEVKQEFENLGFTNIELNETKTESTSYTDGEVSYIQINGWSFNNGETFKPDAKVSIKYYTVVPAEEPSANENALTLENCDELAQLIRLDWQKDRTAISDFVSNHTGATIRIEMITAFVEQSGNYKTRFNYTLYAVDGDRVMLSGPVFMFEDVNYYDLHLVGSNIPDTFGTGIHCEVEAQIVGFEDSMILLDPEAITVIKVP